MRGQLGVRIWKNRSPRGFGGVADLFLGGFGQLVLERT